MALVTKEMARQAEKTMSVDGEPPGHASPFPLDDGEELEEVPEEMPGLEKEQEAAEAQQRNQLAPEV